MLFFQIQTVGTAAVEAANEGVSKLMEFSYTVSILALVLALVTTASFFIIRALWRRMIQLHEKNETQIEQNHKQQLAHLQGQRETDKVIADVYSEVSAHLMTYDQFYKNHMENFTPQVMRDFVESVRDLKTTVNELRNKH